MQGSSNYFTWTSDTIAQLRSLWDEGHSTAEIGRRLGVSKNAVVGKSRRLDLPGRPSPIRRKAACEPPAPRQSRCPTLAELQKQPTSALIAPPLQAVAAKPRPKPPKASPPPQLPRPPVLQETNPVPTAIREKQLCCWPIGEPGTRGFRFCEAPNEAGKPYCPHHCGFAYLKKEDRQSAA